MPVTPTYPGLYIEELPSSSHTITPAPTSITAFVGYTHPFKGLCAAENRWGQAIQIFNFVDYERWFGGLYQPTGDIDANVANAVYQFFLNGGTNAYVVALKPRWVIQASPAATPTRQHLDPGSIDLSQITFTAKELTSGTDPMSITIRNVNGDTADSLISVSPAGGAGWPATFTQGTASIGDLTVPTNAHGTFLAKDFTDAFDTDTSLDKVDIFNLLVVPGVTDNAVMSKALEFCRDNRAFFIMDPATNWSADDTFSPMTKVE